MSHIEKREGKNGTSYRIIVSGGFDYEGNRILHKKTWRPSKPMSEKQAEKMAMREAVLLSFILLKYHKHRKSTIIRLGRKR